MVLKNLLHRVRIPIFLSIVLCISILALVFFLPKRNAANLLRSSGYNVQTNDTTFRGFTSQKISASKGSEQVTLQIVRGVGKDISGNILNQLDARINDIQQEVVITDPYSGKQQELSIPEFLKPVKEAVIIGDIPIIYYIVYTNDIFSMKIFSEAEAKNRGLFSTFYCPREKAVYALEIYSDVEHFDKQKQLSVMSSLFCKQE